MLKERIKNDLKEALKEQRKAEILTLRLLLASILNKEKEKRYKLSKERPELGEKDLEKESELKDEEVLEAISSEVKKRKEAILEFERGKRIDLAEKERMELEILQKYLPEQLSEEEIKKIATSAIEEIGAKESKDIGRVMAQLMPKLKGRADSSLMLGKTFSKSWVAVILIAFLAGGVLIWQLWQHPLFERILQGWWLPEQAEIKVSLDQAFKLRVNQTAFIQEENIKIKFLEMAQDSRCPSDVQCVWQGQVTVVVNILKNDRNLGNFDLTLLVGKEWLETKTFDGYSIKLTKVEPYPKSDETIEISEYITSFVISRETFPTAEWKVYRNEEHGLELNYPQKYFPKESGEGVAKTTTFYEMVNEKEVMKVVIFKNFFGGWACTTPISSEEISVGGEKGSLEIHASMDENCMEINPNGAHMGVLFISHNKIMWFFQLLIDRNKETEEFALFKTMLSTFKFLE